MKANYISPNIDIIEVDVSCLIADSPGGGNNNNVSGEGFDPDKDKGDGNLFGDSRTSQFDDLW